MSNSRGHGSVLEARAHGAGVASRNLALCTLGLPPQIWVGIDLVQVCGVEWAGAWGVKGVVAAGIEVTVLLPEIWTAAVTDFSWVCLPHT